jgi:elongation factor Tu
MPDIEAAITCKRQTPFFNGYRPTHLVTDDYLTTGVHHYYEVEYIQNGETAIGTITFISPEAYPNCLWVGKVLRIQEGCKIVGYATVTKIFNEVLNVKEKL